MLSTEQEPLTGMTWFLLLLLLLTTVRVRGRERLELSQQQQQRSPMTRPVTCLLHYYELLCFHFCRALLQCHRECPSTST